MIFKLDDIIQTKKNHVCGSNTWKVLRTGIDIKIECQGCKRIVMMNGEELKKKLKKENQ